ncbi:MAG TPA: glycosyltransferase [bacterium]|nr:glycosyltransferase [bacterium]
MNDHFMNTDVNHPIAAHNQAASPPGSEQGPPAPEVSVVIITFNRRESLMRTLDALAGQDAAAYEVIVVSDGSTDQTDEAVLSRAGDFPGPLAFFRQDHAGVAAARNRGVAEARGRVVAFTDDDCVPRPDWLRLLLAALGADTGLGGVGGRTRNRPSGKLIPDYSEAYQVTSQPGMANNEVLYLVTCNAAFLRSALNDAGGFDSAQEPAGEDVALSYALRKRGWRLAFEPEALVDHYRPYDMLSFVRTHFNYGRGEMVRLRHDPLPLKLARLAWRSRQFLLWLGLPFFWVRELRRPGRSAAQILMFPALERLRQGLLVAGQWREIRLLFHAGGQDGKAQKGGGERG